MKTLDDVKADIGTLYDESRAGAVDRKLAAELANILGKYLKAYALGQVDRAFLHALSKGRS